MILGVSLIVAAYALLPLAELMPSRLQQGWLLATNALAFVGGPLWAVNGIPFLAGATSPEERGHAFSLQAALLSLAGFAGSLVGGFLPGLTADVVGLSLDGPAPYRYPIWVAAAGYGLIALPALLATRKVAAERTERTRLRSSGAPFGLIASLAVTRLLVAAALSVVSIFFNVYLDAGLGAATSLIGSLSAAASLVAVPASLATAVLLERIGRGRTVFWGALAQIVGLLPLALLPHWAAAGAGLAVATAANSVATAALNVYSQEAVEPRWRAAVSGATMTAWSLSTSIASFGGGYLIAASGYRSLFLSGGGAAILAALLFWILFVRKGSGEVAPDPATSDAADLA
jgi:predicted MFS family arabinose efflux permease